MTARLVTYDCVCACSRIDGRTAVCVGPARSLRTTYRVDGKRDGMRFFNAPSQLKIAKFRFHLFYFKKQNFM